MVLKESDRLESKKRRMYLMMALIVLAFVLYYLFVRPLLRAVI